MTIGFLFKLRQTIKTYYMYKGLVFFFETRKLYSTSKGSLVHRISREVCLKCVSIEPWNVFMCLRLNGFFLFFGVIHSLVVRGKRWRGGYESYYFFILDFRYKFIKVRCIFLSLICLTWSIFLFLQFLYEFLTCYTFSLLRPVKP